MPLAVIGAGFGRTGTMSLKIALGLLGLGPCHHMDVVIGDPEQTAIWRRAADGVLPDWEVAYAGYRSAVDWPTAYFWRELSAAYPEARIVLTVRSFESWYDSVSQTLWPLGRRGNDPDSFGVKVIAQRIFGGRFEDKNYMRRVF